MLQRTKVEVESRSEILIPVHSLSTLEEYDRNDMC